MSWRFRIERLDRHSRDNFDCGEAALNDYLLRQGRQDMRRGVAVCYVLIENDSDRVAGYYTLSAGSLLLDEIPGDLARKLPRYPTVPVARLGRLAIDRQFAGGGLGGVLLVDAGQRAKESGLGVYALVVEAKHETAAGFYAHHGFMPLGKGSHRLFRVLN